MTDIASTSVLEKYRKSSVPVPNVFITFVQLHSSLNGGNIKLLACTKKMNKKRLRAVHAWAGVCPWRDPVLRTQKGGEEMGKLFMQLL